MTLAPSICLTIGRKRNRQRADRLRGLLMRHGRESHAQTSMSHESGLAYGRLAVMAALSFIAMFTLMYAMVDRFSNVYGNLNQAYMAGLMASPMIMIEVLVMASMYPKKSLNVAIILLSAAMLAGFWMLIRKQVGISDQQFLRSMIPHHSGALLMCEQAPLEDPEIKKLCDDIISSQEREITIMKEKLSRSRPN
jgi:hypothetical protein